MSEIGDMFKATKEQRKEGRRKRGQCFLSYARSELAKQGFSFTEHNDGYHFVVKYNSLAADFWPTTGKFKIRSHNNYHRGIHNLIKLMKAGYIRDY